MPATRRGRGEVETTQAGARDDAYLYLLIISLVAMIIGCVLLFMDYDSYTGKPAAPAVQPAVRGTQVAPPAGTPAPPAPPAGGAPVEAPGKTS
jgi:hypothetical protein